VGVFANDEKMEIGDHSADDWSAPHFHFAATLMIVVGVKSKVMEVKSQDLGLRYHA
jgi:hypothetical protein